MSSYSVAAAKNTLPKLIDRALEGEEVVITRHGKAVAEIKPAASPQTTDSAATYLWLQGRRRNRPSLGMTSVEILDRLYEVDEI